MWKMNTMAQRSLNTKCDQQQQKYGDFCTHRKYDLKSITNHCYINPWTEDTSRFVSYGTKNREKNIHKTQIYTHTQRMNSFDETNEENDIINRHWIFFQRFREYIFLRPETRNHIWYYCMLNVNRINTCQFTTNLRAKQSLGRWIHSLSQYIVIIAL